MGVLYIYIYSADFMVVRVGQAKHAVEIFHQKSFHIWEAGLRERKRKNKTNRYNRLAPINLLQRKQ